MIEIKLDVIHRELLLLAGLFATFTGVVFPEELWYGMNLTPLIAFGSVVVIGLLVLLHRRLFTRSSATQSRRRATIWLGLLGAVLGGTASTVLVGTDRSMIYATIGGGLMFAAIGTQFSIIIKSQDDAARAAVERVLDQENVVLAPGVWSSEDSAESANSSQTDSASSETPTQDEDALSPAITAIDAKADGRRESITEDDQRKSIADDESRANEWKPPGTDENQAIPVIRSVGSNEE